MSVPTAIPPILNGRSLQLRVEPFMPADAVSDAALTALAA